MRIDREEGNVARLVITDDGRQKIVATISKIVHWRLRLREFVTQMAWWNDNTGTYYLAISSVNRDVDYGMSINTSVRGFVQSLTKVEPFSDMDENGNYNQCRMSRTLKYLTRKDTFPNSYLITHFHNNWASLRK